MRMTSKPLMIGCLLILACCKGKDIRTPDAEMLRMFEIDSVAHVKARVDSLRKVGFVEQVKLRKCPDIDEFIKDASGISDSSELMCLRVKKERSLFYVVENHFNSHGPCVSFIDLINSNGFVLQWKVFGERCNEMAIPGP